MSKEISRRELMHSIAAGGLMIAGTMTLLSEALAEQVETGAARGPQPQGSAVSRNPATLINGRVVQSKRELSILPR